MRIVIVPVGVVLVVVAACHTATVPRELHVGSPGAEHVLVWVEPSAVAPRGFWIGKCEVTQAQFAAFIAATGYDGREAPSSKPSEPFLADWKDGKPPFGQERYPACQINWYHATAYCRWLSQSTGRSVRLPTTAEWQWVARGEAQRVYPWGDRWDPERCNWGDGGVTDGHPAAAPVGSFPAGASPAGVLDLAGNIWEWSADRQLLGGPWCMGPDSVRSDAAAHEDAMRADDKFGLRIVVDP